VITGVAPNAPRFDTSRYVDIGDLVMQAGRPCLIVPTGVETLALEHAVIGWKDTGEARQVIRDALPLLKQARRVTVVEIAIEEDLEDARSHLVDVVAWLGRHGIDATSIAALSTGDDAVALNGIFQEQGADLIVAGAYGHSRVREWVLGGVTRDLLLRAGCCALVSH
jgi:nucleotide-binding universal stress UspA family protein